MVNAIEVSCKCGQTYRLSVSHAGKMGRCKSCGESFRIPAVPSAPLEKFREPVPRKSQAHQFDRSESIDVRADAVEAFFNAGGKTSLEQFRLGVEAYLLGDQQTFQAAKLDIRISDLRGNTNELRMLVRVDGQVNGIPFAFQDLHRIDLIQEKKDAAFAAGAAAPLTGWFMHAAADRASKKPPEEASRWLKKRLFPLLRESLRRLEPQLYSACGVKESVSTHRWRSVFIASLITPVVAGLGTLITVLLTRPADIVLLTIPPFFVAVTSFFFVQSFALLFMPDTFFLHEPAGRNALKFSGASSPMGARVIASIVAVICTGIIVATVVALLVIE